jgi:hypothetical protein
MKDDIWECLDCGALINDEIKKVIDLDGNEYEYTSELVEYCRGCDTYYTEDEVEFKLTKNDEDRICEYCIDAREERKYQMQELYREP